jgi:hypothetical protein
MVYLIVHFTQHYFLPLHRTFDIQQVYQWFDSDTLEDVTTNMNGIDTISTYLNKNCKKDDSNGCGFQDILFWNIFFFQDSSQ